MGNEANKRIVSIIFIFTFFAVFLPFLPFRFLFSKLFPPVQLKMLISSLFLCSGELYKKFSPTEHAAIRLK